MSQLSKRKPLLALLLSLLTPGLGQLYNGDLKKAVLFFFAVSGAGMFVIAAAESFLAAALLFLLFLALALSCAVNAYAAAKRSGGILLGPYNRWYVYLLILLTVGFVQLRIGVYAKAHYARAFKVPSSSMEPTLLAGDHFILDTNYFDSHAPARGDVVVLTLPDEPSTAQLDESQTYILKRVTAVAGDTVAVEGVSLLINGQPVREPFAVWLQGGLFGFPASVVPPGHVFVLGDNRDRSRDSRHWANPFVDQSRLVGKALYLYWPPSRMGRRVT